MRFQIIDNATAAIESCHLCGVEIDCQPGPIIAVETVRDGLGPVCDDCTEEHAPSLLAEYRDGK